MNNHLRTAKFIAELLEIRFSLFGFRFGLEPVISLFPILGDLVSLGLSLYIIAIARHMNVPASIISAMVGNVTIDFLIGLIPVIGEIGDFMYKANSRNLKLLEDYLKVHEGEILDNRKQTKTPLLALR